MKVEAIFVAPQETLAPLENTEEVSLPENDLAASRGDVSPARWAVAEPLDRRVRGRRTLIVEVAGIRGIDSHKGRGHAR
jgi:hypothetical protein